MRVLTEPLPPKRKPKTSIEMTASPRLEMISARWRVNMIKFVRRSAIIFSMIYDPFVYGICSRLLGAQFAPGQVKENVFQRGCAHLQVRHRNILLRGICQQRLQRRLHFAGVDEEALVGLSYAGYTGKLANFLNG